MNYNKSRLDLEKELVADPLDNSAWQVYADLLLERGELRGEYITLIEQLKSTELDHEKRELWSERLSSISPKKLDGIVNCFFIEELKDRYRMHNVPYLGEMYVVDWSKKLLDHGTEHGQDEWILLTKRIKWKIPNSQLVHASVSALYNNRNHTDRSQNNLVEKVVDKVFTPDLRDNWPTTSTRVAYKPDGIDIVTHDLGYPTQREIQEKMMGEEGVINASCGFEAAVNALLGISDISEIDQVYKWLSGQDSYLFRVNDTPKQEELRAVVLSLSGINEGLGIYAGNVNDTGIYSDAPARGVVATRVQDFRERRDKARK